MLLLLLAHGGSLLCHNVRANGAAHGTRGSIAPNEPFQWYTVSTTTNCVTSIDLIVGSDVAAGMLYRLVEHGSFVFGWIVDAAAVVLLLLVVVPGDSVLDPIVVNFVAFVIGHRCFRTSHQI